MTTSAISRAAGTGQTADTATGAVPGSGRARARHIEGLDGLRALAIAAVLVYHLNASWLPGGFLGVDVFFVVSGFLITTLLVREHHRTGRIALSQFWVRRARRLLPALVLCVVTSVLIARLVTPGPPRRRRPADGRRPDLLDELDRDHGRHELLRPDRAASSS